MRVVCGTVWKFSEFVLQPKFVIGSDSSFARRTGAHHHYDYIMNIETQEKRPASVCRIQIGNWGWWGRFGRIRIQPKILLKLQQWLNDIQFNCERQVSVIDVVTFLLLKFVSPFSAFAWRSSSKPFHRPTDKLFPGTFQLEPYYSRRLARGEKW